MNKSRQLVIRFFSLSDQIFVSAANLLLTITLARYYSEIEFAAYGIGLSIALTLLGVQRNCYVVQNSLLHPSIMRNRTSKVLGQQAIVWFILLIIESMVLAALVIFSDNSFYLTISASTIVCSLIYAQMEFDRMILIKHDKYWYSVITSGTFFIFIAVLFFFAPKINIPYFFVLLILGGYVCLKFIFLLIALGRPHFFWGWRLVKRDFRKNFIGAISGIIGYSGHNHVPLFILGLVAAPAQVGAFVAMRGLLQPLQIIIRSFDVIDKNLFSIKSEGKVHGIREVFIRQVSVYGVLALVMVFIMAIFGETISYFAYGEKYSIFNQVLMGWTLISSMLVISLPMETVIVKLDKLNTYNFYRILAGITGSVVAFFLCGPFGAMGAVIACLIGWLVSCACAFWIVREIIFPKWKNSVLVLNQ